MATQLKNKFTGMFKGWFGGAKKSPPTAAPARPATPPPTFSSTTLPPKRPPAPVAAPAPVVPPPAPSEDANELEIPLASVLNSLPPELRAKVAQMPPEGSTMTISMEAVLTQLAHGAVKITFGELRQAAPSLFSNSGGGFDQKEFALPLNEILSRVNPGLLARRRTQKKIQVADDIASPFGAQGQGAAISNISKPAPPPKVAPAPTPLPQRAVPAAPVAPPPVAAPPPAFMPRWSTPSGSQNGATTPASSASLPVNSIGGGSAPAPASAPDLPSILAPLAALSGAWPDALKLEIVQQNLNDAQVALPFPLIEPALKRGRVTFPWRTIRTWIKPTPPPVSVHDGVELELPLNIIAPMFFAKQKGAPVVQRKISVSAEIPDLFSGTQKPSVAPVASVAPEPPVAFSPVPPAPKVTSVAAAIPPQDTNFFTRHAMPAAGTGDTELRRKGGMDVVGEPVTPQEIVGRAISLPGVAGVVIALPDGLKVASHVPPDLNADTLAAFLPQLFGRVSQCSAQLRMGELNNLNFTVGNVPWKIFRVNAVYFAVFGRAGEPLPTAQLAGLATELDHKRK